MPIGALHAGSLNRRGVIQDRVTTQGNYGEQSQAWADVATVWMSFQPLTGRELQAAQQLSTEISHRVVIRYQAQFADPKVMATRRIVYKNRYFNIHAAINTEEAHVSIELLCSEGVNKGQ